MKVGSLVRNTGSFYRCSFGVVLKVKGGNALIYWFRSNRATTWSSHSARLEVICE